METRIRILTADPNREFCRQLSELMAAEGDMEIIGMAADGLEALERVAELKPDLLLLELVLPKLDGLEVLRRLRDKGTSCRVIVLSGFVNGKVIAECSDCGADYFIPKPCDTQALISRIRQLSFDLPRTPGVGVDFRQNAEGACKKNGAIFSGVNCYDGKITNANVAKAFDYDFVDLLSMI